MTYVIRVAVLLALGCSLAAGQVPDAAGGLPLALDEAIGRGLEASHRLDEAAARADAARAVADQRRAAALPQVAAQAGYTRTNHVEQFAVPAPGSGQLRILYPDIPDNYRSRLDIQWPFYTSGRLEAIRRAALREADAVTADMDAARSDLRLEIIRTYWALATAIESARVVDQSLERMASHLRDVRNQFASGLIPPNEVLTVEAQQSRQRMFAIQARANRDIVEADLARLIGAPPGTRIQPVSTLTPPAAIESNEEAAVAAARDTRRERVALVDRLEGAAEREKAALAGTRPTVAASGGVDYARPNPRIFPREGTWRTSWDASVNVNWPLLDGGRGRAEVAEASASRRALQARLDEFDAVVAVEVRQRRSELESARAAISAADEAVRAAAEARRVAGERFTAGVATSTDVLDAQVVLLQAELDRTQALANARLAEARLARATGM
jgi:outer membrane protein TolC